MWTGVALGNFRHGGFPPATLLHFTGNAFLNGRVTKTRFLFRSLVRTLSTFPVGTQYIRWPKIGIAPTQSECNIYFCTQCFSSRTIVMSIRYCVRILWLWVVFRMLYAMIWAYHLDGVSTIPRLRSSRLIASLLTLPSKH